MIPQTNLGYMHSGSQTPLMPDPIGAAYAMTMVPLGDTVSPQVAQVAALQEGYYDLLEAGVPEEAVMQMQEQGYDLKAMAMQVRAQQRSQGGGGVMNTVQDVFNVLNQAGQTAGNIFQSFQPKGQGPDVALIAGVGIAALVGFFVLRRIF